MKKWKTRVDLSQQHYQFYYYRETYPFMRQKTYLQHEPSTDRSEVIGTAVL